MFSTNFRKATAVTLLSITSVVGFASMASAQETTTKQKTPSCTGAADHKQAQALRLQALDFDLKAAHARLAEATAKNKPEAVARITARIAKINARIAEVKANQAKLAAKCP